MTASPLPTVTVVTPSFNQAEFLEEALESVLAQRDEIHEYFVVDGGSDDGSVGIIEQHADRIDWWVSEPDDGQCDAIAKGFQRATGDILYWLNSDDALLPGAVRDVRGAFAADPSLDVVQGNAVTIEADGRVRWMRRAPTDSRWRAKLGYHRVHQPSTFFRRELYERVGGLDADLHCVLDTELWLRMLRAGANWGGIDRYLAADRKHGDQKRETLRARYADERRLLRERYPEFCAVGQVRHALGRIAYYASQLGSGRTFRSISDDRRCRGKPWQDVFQAEQDVAR